LRTPGRYPEGPVEKSFRFYEMGDADEPKTMAGHQATKRMAKCCVPNAVGTVRSLIKSMTVLNEARIRIKKKTLKTSKWAFVIVLIKDGK
jgi:hypothetical protein